MKKFFILSAIATLLLTGCSNNANSDTSYYGKWSINVDNTIGDCNFDDRRNHFNDNDENIYKGDDGNVYMVGEIRHVEENEENEEIVANVDSDIEDTEEHVVVERNREIRNISKVKFGTYEHDTSYLNTKINKIGEDKIEAYLYYVDLYEQDSLATLQIRFKGVKSAPEHSISSDSAFVEDINKLGSDFCVYLPHTNEFVVSYEAEITTGFTGQIFFDIEGEDIEFVGDNFIMVSAG